MRPAGRRIGGLALLGAVALSAACGAAAPSPQPLAEVTEMASPAGVGSSEPFLWSGDDGLVYLCWLEPTDESLWESASTRRGAFQMRFATLGDGEWSEPRTIAEGEHFSANWANFPSLIRLRTAPSGTRTEEPEAPGSS